MTKYIRNSALFAVAAVIGMSGCTNKEQTVDLSQDKILQLQNDLDAKNAKIKQLENENSRNDNAIPLNAKAGECYAKVLVPAQYETKEIKQLLKEADQKIEIVPATYKVVDKKVTIREESTKLVTVPATYKIVTETIMVEPEKTIITTIPATYKTETETIMVEPEKTTIITVPATYKNVSEQILIKDAYTAWEKGRGEIEKLDNSTGEIMCLVDHPAVYETVTKQVIDTPATTQEVKVPAVYKTVERQVVDALASTQEIKIPAVYKTVETQVIDTPETTREVKIPAICKMVPTRVLDTAAKEIKTDIPAVYTMVPTTVKIADSFFRWESILCETNTTEQVISKLQNALKEKGYNITKANGLYNEETKSAVKTYQKDNNLTQGALTLETLKSLGL